jgi:hypothetical protein
MRFRPISLKKHKIEYEVEVERIVIVDPEISDQEQSVTSVAGNQSPINTEFASGPKDIQIEYGFISGKMLRVRRVHGI